MPSDSVEFAAISAEVDSFNLPSKSIGKSDCTTQWLTLTGQSYSWSNAQGTEFVRNPLPLDDFPGISDMMHRLNSIYGTELNSCLVSCLPNGQSKLRLHDDGEDSLDDKQPIIVFSFGAERNVDFRGKYQPSNEKSALSIRPPSGSIYQMLPGCQTWFKHQVMGDNSCTGRRYSLSFRKMILKSHEPEITQPVAQHSPSADGTTSPSLESASLARSGHIPLPPIRDILPNCSQAPPGTSDFDLPTEKISSPVHAKRSVGGKGVSVLFGTSITSRVDASRLGRKGRKVLNFSESGARIHDIKRMVDDFHDYHVDAQNVDKIILCFGTNDIKHSKSGVRHLVSPVFSLINRCKSHFPGALIFICSNLPMRNMYNYTVHNFISFNNILRDACFKTNTYYLDCFDNFLSTDKMDYNRYLFRDNLHLNRKGLGVLCSILKMVINCDCYSSSIICEYGYFGNNYGLYDNKDI